MQDPDSELTDRHKLTSILHLSHLLSTSLRMEEVYDNALKALEECLGAGDSSIYEVDYETGELFFRLARGAKAKDLMDRRIKIGEGVAGWVAMEGQSKIVTDVASDAQFYNGFDRELGFQTRNMLTVPLITKGTVIGVVQLLNKKDGRLFSRADLELSRIMAGQIAIAMENAKLYSRLEEKQKETEAELKKTQKRLIRTERQAALAGLVKSIAHQIRNPCMSIGGFARRIMKKAGPDQDDLRQFAGVIIEENQRLEEMVKKVAFMVGVKPKLSLQRINPVVKNAVKKSFRGDYGSRVVLELAQNLPPLFFDPMLIETSLDEIIRNAHEAGADTVTVRTRAIDNHVLIETVDNGPGMSERDCSAALDPFYSTRAHNYGLGLALVHRIITEHNGEIEVESEPGKGVSVILALPIQSGPVDG